MAKRPNGAGSIYKQADGRWVAAVCIGSDEEGSVVRIRAYAKTQKQAKAKLVELRDRHERHFEPMPAAPIVPTDEMYQQLREENRVLRALLDDMASAGECVYFLRRQDGLVKIGTTTVLKDRLKALQSEHGELELLGLVAGGQRVERALHWRFSEDRVEGEWFRYSRALRRFVEMIEEPPLPGLVPGAPIVLPRAAGYR